MGTLITVLLASTLLAVLFGSIACDECRRLGRRLTELEEATR